jgi:uncharacterized protein (TIGR02118 family)
MIKVSAMYPNVEGSRFDIEYYCQRHMPMVKERLGSAIKRIEVEQGLAGRTPDAPASFRAAGHLYFESLEAFRGAFAPHAQVILADVPNYTDLEPQVQISEVVL